MPGPIGQAGLPEPPLPPPPQLKAAPRGESSHPERTAIERTEVLGGGVCCPRGLNETDLGYIPFAPLSLLTSFAGACSPSARPVFPPSRTFHFICRVSGWLLVQINDCLLG